MCDEAQLFALTDFSGQRFAEIAEVVGESLLLFVDVELFYIIDEFLFETVLVIIHTGEFGKTFLEASADFFHATLFERFDAVEECLDAVDVVRELLCERFAFLETEVLQSLDGAVYCVFHYVPFLVRKLFCGSRLREFGQTGQNFP